MSPSDVPGPVIERLKRAVGAGGWTVDPDQMAPWLLDEQGLYRGQAAILLRPASTEAVAAAVRICAEAGVGIVPQGGNTGLVGGAVPDRDGGQVLLCLSRLNRIRAVDAVDFTATVEAGCVLADVQAAAEEAGLLFPLSLAAEGTCQIGGNLATNAGGTAVLRYGNARELVLGLEVVLASGEVWSGLRRLRKDNTGYDLKQAFIGSEGTLGIITAAVLKLFPRPRHMCTALVATPGVAAATELLGRLRAAGGEAVSTFEYMHRHCLELVLRHIPGARDPLGARHEHYVLAELTSPREHDDLGALLEGALEAGYEADAVLDAVIAASDAQARELWRLRESIPEAERRDGAVIKHDVSVPVSRVAELIEQAWPAVLEEIPDALVGPFGHLGDGNIHFNLNQPAGMEREAFLARAPAVNRRVTDIVMGLEGSFSAEHGIGRFKRGALARYKPALEVALMRQLKQVLDPHGILNPGKVV